MADNVLTQNQIDSLLAQTMGSEPGTTQEGCVRTGSTPGPEWAPETGAGSGGLGC